MMPLEGRLEILGYRVTLSLDEYRKLYAEGRIKDAILDRIIIEQTRGKQT